MNNYQEAKLNMYDATIANLDENAILTAGTPALTNAIDEFRLGSCPHEPTPVL